VDIYISRVLTCIRAHIETFKPVEVRCAPAHPKQM